MYWNICMCMYIFSANLLFCPKWYRRTEDATYLGLRSDVSKYTWNGEGLLSQNTHTHTHTHAHTVNIQAKCIRAISLNFFSDILVLKIVSTSIGAFSTLDFFWVENNIRKQIVMKTMETIKTHTHWLSK